MVDVSDEDNEDPNALNDDVSFSPNDAADPTTVVEQRVPEDIRAKYEVYSYKNAAVILSETRKVEFQEILNALRAFSTTTETIRKAGGNESDIPKFFSANLRPLKWHETRIHADLHVTLSWRKEVGKSKSGKPLYLPQRKILKRERFLDGHKIDYVKDKVAFDLEWNSKDQTFDRDLYAFNTFFLSGAIDVAILLTRSASLDEVFKSVGPALKRDGKTIEALGDGKTPRPTMSKYGASTTWMGKLLYRLNAGRNGGCPVLALGITPACVSDWTKPAAD